MIRLNNTLSKLIILAAAAFAVAAAYVVFSGILPPVYERQFDERAFGPPSLDFRLASFYELEGWQQDDPTAAFAAFLRSCAILVRRSDEEPANSQEYLGEDLAEVSLAGTVSDWRPVCAEASRINDNLYADPAVRRGAMRVFFENYFTPVQILERRTPLADGPARKQQPKLSASGLFTGYYEPIYDAARMKTTYFSAPVYRRPDDLVEVELGQFREDLSGQRVAGKLNGAKLVPYPDRRMINDGALAKSTQPIAWMAPNDLFFLQIQGSGRLRFGNGEEMRIGYDGQNGHPYTAIGRVMVERQIMPLESISMQTILAWLNNVGEREARAMREENASYVFFRELNAPEDGLGPPGAQGVPLTPERSLAVDRRYHALGAPIWVEIEPTAENGDQPLRQLMIAQDTGGAIRGPVRGDFFWGAGPQAAARAGVMRARGKMYVLTPRSVAARLRKNASASSSAPLSVSGR